MTNNQSKTDVAARLLSAADKLNLDSYSFSHYTNQVSAGFMARLLREGSDQSRHPDSIYMEEMYQNSVKVICFLEEVGELLNELRGND